jgi:hypothetical protein
MDLTKKLLANIFISQSNTQTMHLKTNFQISMAIIPLITYKVPQDAGKVQEPYSGV